MANDNRVPNPVLPLPPLEYDVQYMNQLIRVINYYMEQQNNPGDARFSSVTIADADPDVNIYMSAVGNGSDLTTVIFAELPTSATGLASGQLWRDTGTNIIHIVP